MKAGFIGAGKVGFSLGKLFAERGIEVAGYADRDTTCAAEAAQFTDTKCYRSNNELANDCDVLFFTVPDGLITTAYRSVLPETLAGKIICHCSGALSSVKAFPDAAKLGTFAYSVHPMSAVSDRYNAYRELKDVFFTLEGAPGRLDEMKAFLTKGAGLEVQVIDPDSKERYHLAASVASNLVLALIQESIELLKECGFSEDRAIHALAPLVTGNASHAVTAGPVAALTGPVERGDTETLKKHLRQLETPQEKQAYLLLSQKLVTLAETKHPERSYADVRQLLERAGKELTK